MHALLLVRTSEVKQQQFDAKWAPGKANMADYHTKHHAAKHHRHVRPWYLHMKHSPLSLPTLSSSEGVLNPSTLVKARPWSGTGFNPEWEQACQWQPLSGRQTATAAGLPPYLCVEPINYLSQPFCVCSSLQPRSTDLDNNKRPSTAIGPRSQSYRFYTKWQRSTMQSA